MALSEDERAELVAYLDGELDEQATQAVEARIATDPDARAELDALKQTWGMLDYLPRANPSPNFTHRTMEKLTLESVPGTATSKLTAAAPARRIGWTNMSWWAAGILVAAGLGFWAAPHLLPTPVDSISESDEPLVRHLRIIEKWRYYENVDERDFLDGLAQPDLFGDEPS